MPWFWLDRIGIHNILIKLHDETYGSKRASEKEASSAKCGSDYIDLLHTIVNNIFTRNKCWILFFFSLFIIKLFSRWTGARTPIYLRWLWFGSGLLFGTSETSIRHTSNAVFCDQVRWNWATLWWKKRWDMFFILDLTWRLIRIAITCVVNDIYLSKIFTSCI